MRKGVNPFLSAAIYVGIVTATIILVTQTGLPTITKMEDLAAIEQAKNTFTVLNKYIQDVASEGKGSTRIVQVQTKGGTFKVDNESNKVEYEINTKAAAVSSRTKRKIGVLTIGANANVDVSYNDTHYLIENNRLNLSFLRYGINNTNPPVINISNVTRMFFNKGQNVSLNSIIDIKIDGNSVVNGSGYTEVSQTGNDLAEGIYIIHLNCTTHSLGYDLHITLPSEADFIELEVLNYQTLS